LACSTVALELFALVGLGIAARAGNQSAQSTLVYPDSIARRK
jgi:hypothetical protein